MLKDIHRCNEAKAFLLANVPSEGVKVNVIMQMATDNGINTRTLRRAADGLIVSNKVGKDWIWKKRENNGMPVKFFDGLS